MESITLIDLIVLGLAHFLVTIVSFKVGSHSQEDIIRSLISSELSNEHTSAQTATGFDWLTLLQILKLQNSAMVLHRHGVHLTCAPEFGATQTSPL